MQKFKNAARDEWMSWLWRIMRDDVGDDVGRDQII